AGTPSAAGRARARATAPRRARAITSAAPREPSERGESGARVKRETADIEIARLRQEKAVADRRLARLRGLARLSGLIASSLDLDGVLRELARAAAELMDGEAVGLWVADAAPRPLEPRAFSNEQLATTSPRRRIKFDEGLPGWVAAHREPL